MDLFNKQKVQQLCKRINDDQCKLTEYRDQVKGLNRRIDSLERISTSITEENHKLKELKGMDK